MKIVKESAKRWSRIIETRLANQKTRLKLDWQHIYIYIYIYLQFSFRFDLHLHFIRHPFALFVW